MPTNTAEPTPTDEPALPTVPFTSALAYNLPGMEQAVVRNVEYRSVEGVPFFMDIYYPAQIAADQRLPVVIFVMGYSDEAAQRLIGSPLKDFGQYISWGRLVAAAGMIGVTYETKRADDLGQLVQTIQQNGDALNIDADRIGLWSSSANALTAVSFAMQDEHDFLSFAVFYYGSMLAPDDFGLVEVNAACRNLGCYAPDPDRDLYGLPKVEQIRVDLPLLIVRAGKDDTPGTNISIDHFAEQALAAGAQLTLLEHPDAGHAFDIGATDEKTSEIMAQTLEFMAALFAEP